MYFIRFEDVFTIDSVITYKSGNIYKVSLNQDLIYPFNLDPNNYVENACMPIYSQLEQAYHKSKRDGYIGLVARWMNSYRVDCWEKAYNPVRIEI